MPELDDTVASALAKRTQPTQLEFASWPRLLAMHSFGKSLFLLAIASGTWFCI